MYRGFYLNLDRDVERRHLMRRQLEVAGLFDHYRRFEAVDGAHASELAESSLKPGELGCWLSHERLLCERRASDHHLHVLEDDTILPADARGLFDAALMAIDQRPELRWDLLFTDVFLPPNLRWFQELGSALETYRSEGTLRLMDLAHSGFACASSYFVNRTSIGKVADLLEGHWRRNVPVDIFLRARVDEGQLAAYTTAPFLTSVGEESEDSSIRGDLDASRRVLQLYRRSFYKDADHDALLAQLEELRRDARLTPHRAIFAGTLAFQLSDRWKSF